MNIVLLFSEICF